MPTYAAIDVGSNATRLSLQSVSANGVVSEAEFHRYPVRLGADVFATGSIGAVRGPQLLEACNGMAQLLASRGVSHYRAVATAAMRDAANGAQYVQQIKETYGIALEIIAGTEESRLSRSALLRAVGTVPADGILIDLGGGSLEIEPVTGVGQSLPLGSVRLLEQQPALRKGVAPDTFAAIRAGIKAVLETHCPAPPPAPLAIGTGGNLDVLAHLLPVANLRMPSIDVAQLEPFTYAVAAMTLDERMRVYGVRPDRADLILPAVLIISALVQHFRLPTLVVPGTGLREALLHSLSAPVAPGSQARALAVDVHADVRHADVTATLAEQLFTGLAPLHGLWAPALQPLLSAIYAWYAAARIDARAALPHALYLLAAVERLSLLSTQRTVAAWALGRAGGLPLEVLPPLASDEAAPAAILAGILQQCMQLGAHAPRRPYTLTVDLLTEPVCLKVALRKPLQGGISPLLEAMLQRPVAIE